MSIQQFFRFITVDPVNLSIKGKLLSVLSSFIAILAVAWVTQTLSISAAYPIIVASMGASAVILFIIPHSPLAQPWPLVGGHLISAIIGIACAQLIYRYGFCIGLCCRWKCSCHAVAALPASSGAATALDAHHGQEVRLVLWVTVLF